MSRLRRTLQQQSMGAGAGQSCFMARSADCVRPAHPFCTEEAKGRQRCIVDGLDVGGWRHAPGGEFLHTFRHMMSWAQTRGNKSLKRKPADMCSKACTRWTAYVRRRRSGATCMPGVVRAFFLRQGLSCMCVFMQVV